MEQRHWFKAKTYGYGWYPATWEGWVVLIGFVLLTFQAFRSAYGESHDPTTVMVAFVPVLIFNLIALLLICILTGEKAKWRWGKK